MTGIVAVTPGQILYVSVGGAGGLPAGGFNGGGDGGTRRTEGRCGAAAAPPTSAPFPIAPGSRRLRRA